MTVGAAHLKTTIVQNGVTKQVADYATVSLPALRFSSLL